uniref:DRBM domain-containing protein n=1 Tax=Ananas comosus var. bracteatus TaxID=296719 RepID=A0A6V7QYN3_ANACO
MAQSDCVGTRREGGRDVQEPAAGAGAEELLQPAVVRVREGRAGPRAAVQGVRQLQRRGLRRPSNCTTLRQAEHAAAEVALSNLSVRAPSTSLAARVLDETGVYKNLLQETAHRAGLKLPLYTTVRSGPGHQPIFTSTVEIAGWTFTGDSAKTKKQAEKNAALAAWTALKQMPDLGSCSNQEKRSLLSAVKSKNMWL